MKVNKEALRAARSLLGVCRTDDGTLDASKVQAVVTKVSERKPRGYLGILDCFARMLRLEREKSEAVVESAVDLDAATRQSVQDDLRAKYGKDISAEFRTVPELVGGVRIRVGSDIWDGSVRTRLLKLQERLG